ncbi:hypothetical protein TTHT_1281 [Thermotomaculum hydrothermale]|uniref:POTRA domain-containing protein n=1 Tax=Thermotomaculum hydrothermale TaxID=981385 RepID=A0A7R6PNF7_9BACT|nr:FtsQ-type POTRA domain-containing protein [Thermotomaculum hydrothermale]BBB32798.1 hypothetical protein TTHT_1281 [Thermotomaculum hydrothermale]
MSKVTKKLRFRFKRFIREKGKSLLISFATVIVIFSLSMIVFPPLKDFIFGIFVIENIKIEGVEYNDAEDLKNALEIYKGRVNWSIDREELKHYLKSRFKWIKSVAISNFPSKTLVLYIEEQEPIVFYRNKKGILWIVGENGEILNRYYAKKFGYLYLPIIQCDKDYIPYVVSKLKMLRNRKDGSDFLKDTSEIVVKDRDSKWVVFLKNFKARVYVDPFGQFKNIEAFLRMENRLIEDLGKIDYVDISFNNQLIVKKGD